MEKVSKQTDLKKKAGVSILISHKIDFKTKAPEQETRKVTT